jgi:transcription elongation factor GreB
VNGNLNYITADGLAVLRARYDVLFSNERPKLVETVSWAAGNGDRSENGDYIYGKRRLREIDRELGWLSKRIKAAQVVDITTQTDTETVLFGATVEIVDANDNKRVVTIVGDDEQDVTNGRIGWSAPLARALRGAKIGEERFVALPNGEVSYEILAIRYGRGHDLFNTRS